MTTTFPLESPARPRGVRRVLLESGYNLSAFFIALAAFVLVVVNLSLGLALTVFVGGVLLLALAVNVARGFARLERFRMRTMLGREAATPVYLCGRPDAGLLAAVADPAARPAVLARRRLVDPRPGHRHAGVRGDARLVGGAVGGLTYWFWQHWIPTNSNDTGPGRAARVRRGPHRGELGSTWRWASRSCSPCRWWCGWRRSCTPAWRRCC